MVKSWNEFRNVLFEIVFGEVTISCSIIQTDMNSGLEKVVLSDDGVEERLHVDSTVLISIEFEESGCTEEMSELQRKL